MVYCHGCGKQIHVTAVSCPQCGAAQHAGSGAAPGDKVNNTLVWILAFAPLVGLMLEAMVAGAMQASDEGIAFAMNSNKYWFVTLALNIALSYSDEAMLKKAGIDTSKLKVWLVPVYLYQRAKALDQNIAYFVVWMVCFGITLAQ